MGGCWKREKSDDWQKWKDQDKRNRRRCEHLALSDYKQQTHMIYTTMNVQEGRRRKNQIIGENKDNFLMWYMNLYKNWDCLNSLSSRFITIKMTAL
jgi:hypothetical protein